MINPLMGKFKSELNSFVDIEHYVVDILEMDWLFPKQMEVLKEFYQRDPELGHQIYNEMILLAGMRSGKTILGSVISSFEGYKLLSLGKPATFYGLPKGQDIFILNIATSDRQARDTVFSQIKARVDNSDWWQDQSFKEHYNEFIFKTKDCNIIFRSAHSNSSSLAGKTNKCVVLDETARFVDTGGKSSGKLVYDTVSRGVRTFGRDGILVSISSPLYVDDFQMKLYRMAIETNIDGSKKHTTMLGKKYATWEMNENITKESLQTEFEKDPDAAWRDWGAEPSASLEVYCKEPWKIDLIMKHERENVGEVARKIIDGEKDESELSVYVKTDKVYFMAGDPAFKNDAFGLAMGHWEDQIYLYDMVWRFTPDLDLHQREVDTEKLKEFILLIARYFPVYSMMVDTWQYPETIQALKKSGVNVEQHFVNKETYDMLKEGIYMGTVLMPFYPLFKQEFMSLELKRGTKIDHPKGGSKDVADACANCYYLAKTGVHDQDVPIFAGVKTW